MFRHKITCPKVIYYVLPLGGISVCPTGTKLYLTSIEMLWVYPSLGYIGTAAVCCTEMQIYYKKRKKVLTCSFI